MRISLSSCQLLYSTHYLPFKLLQSLLDVLNVLNFFRVCIDFLRHLLNVHMQAI
jgi:hypothetical protein